MTLLELVTQVMAELGLQSVAGVVGNQEPSVRQIFALMNRLGNDLERERDWQRLVREHILTTQAEKKSVTLTEGNRIVTMASTSGLSERWGASGEGLHQNSQIVSVDGATSVTLNMPATKSGTFEVTLSQIDYPLPSDWKKQIPQTEWGRTNSQALAGPQTAQAWQAYKSGIVYSGARERFRIMGNSIAISPPPPDGLIFAYEYISKNWVISNSGSTKPRFDTDSDTCIYDDSLMVLGTKVLFLQAKGLDFSLEAQQFTNLLNLCKAQDASAPVISTVPGQPGRFMSLANVPSGNWGDSW